MQCEKCGVPLNDGDLYCGSCGDKFVVREKKRELDKASENMKNVFIDQSHSLIFLILTICFTASCVFLAVSVLTSLLNIFAVLGSILPLIFSIITTVGLWQAYTAKPGADMVKIMRRASIYDAYTSVMYSIYITLVAIVGGITLFSTIMAGVALGEMTGSEDVAGGGIVTALIVLVIIAVIETVLSLIKSIFKNRRAYFCAVGEAANTGSYRQDKAPVIPSYILGGYMAIGSIFSIIGAAALSSIISGVAEMLPIPAELIDMVTSMSSGALISQIMAQIPNLCVAAYYILSAVWMSSVHNAVGEKNTALKAASNAYEIAKRDTEEAIKLEELQRRKADDERRAADQKAQQSMQEQQQMMMQMMMQQMMQNGGMAMNMDPNAAVHAAATPAAEAPVAEAPVAEEPIAEEPAAEEPAAEDANV